ncbi:MAG: hypothetical protein J6T82_08540 [Bacteroidaceae bacterium]|nr:hypothetical protein [Bacteroidaceae bacterium]
MENNKEIRLAFSQQNLGCIYESAKARMKAHPKRAADKLKTVEGCPHFESKKEAEEFAIKMAKEKPYGGIKLWATIKKEEEFYLLGAPWLVSDGNQHMAAEYVGLCFIDNAYNLI